MKELHGRWALVTGAGSGIGRATAILLANHGANIVVQDLVADRVDVVAEEISQMGAAVVRLVCDVQSESELVRAVDGVPPVTILVNNAGITGENSQLEAIDRATYEKMFNVHVWGAFASLRAVLPGMKTARAGRIVNIASNRGQVGFERSSHYCSAKAALLGATKAWARELAPWSINCNAIAPGVVRTPMTLSYGEKAIQEEAQQNLLGRAASPDEIASWIKILVTSSGDFMTGQVICPNGGYPIVGI